MPAKTILKDRDSKPLIEQLRKIPGLAELSHKGRVEIQTVKDAEIISVNGDPVAVKVQNRLVPILLNVKAVEKLPKVVVDMGAVPHVVGGADIMAPGIRKVQGSFNQNDLLVIVDEKYGKSLAIGSSLLSSEILASTKKGKVITNLHYVGDPVWETVKVV
jgi:PUA domain protein